MVGIYKITSPCGGIYIGQSINLASRIRKHKAALISYGCFNHAVTISYQLPDDIKQSVLDQYERLFIDQYRDCGVKVLNINSGGKDNFECGAATKQKISIGNQGKKLSDSRKANITKASTGRKHTAETKEYLRKINTGRKMSIESKKKMSESKRGKPMHEVTKRALILSTKGIPKSEITKLRMREGSMITKPVFQFSKQGEYIKDWVSVAEAHRFLNIHRGDIASCARGVLPSAGGFIWKYAKSITP